MTNKQKARSERRIEEWASRGWLTSEGEKQLRHQMMEEIQPMVGMALSLHVIIGIISILLAGVIGAWAIAEFWAHFTPGIRLVLAAVLLALSQVGAAVLLLQGQQGALRGEIGSVVHYLFLFVAFAIVKQTFYVGWDAPSYIALCAVLGLPAVYLLRAAAGVLVYCLSVLARVSLSGFVDAPGGVGFMWFLLLLPLPLYGVFMKQGDELRLSVFSWLMTITLYTSFGIAMITEEYIPFLLLASLAVTMMLIGYSIDIHKAYGVPFRWFGRFAAAGSLLLSCLPPVWNGIAAIEGFHWTMTAMVLALFAVMIGLLAKEVKKVLWSPLLYVVIPLLLGGETLLVRSGIYSSLPLLLSAVYAIFIGGYELLQGLKPGHLGHLRFGIIVLVLLVCAISAGGVFSPAVLVVTAAVLFLLFIQGRRLMRKKGKSGRSLNVTKTVTSVRKEKKRAAVHERDGETGVSATQEEAPSWMQLDDGASVNMTAVDTVIPRKTESSLFVEPVFHSPEDIPAGGSGVFSQSSSRDERKKAEPSPWSASSAATPAGGATSPWTNSGVAPKREKVFSHSPWSQEGERR